MSQYITLLGSEDVTRAGRNMQDAATQISRAMEQFNFDVGRLENLLRETMYELTELSQKQSEGK